MEHFLCFRHCAMCCRYLVQKAESILRVQQQNEPINIYLCISTCLQIRVSAVSEYISSNIQKLLSTVGSVDRHRRRNILTQNEEVRSTQSCPKMKSFRKQQISNTGSVQCKWTVPQRALFCTHSNIKWAFYCYLSLNIFMSKLNSLSGGFYLGFILFDLFDICSR